MVIPIGCSFLTVSAAALILRAIKRLKHETKGGPDYIHTANILCKLLRNILLCYSLFLHFTFSFENNILSDVRIISFVS